MDDLTIEGCGGLKPDGNGIKPDGDGIELEGDGGTATINPIDTII